MSANQKPQEKWKWHITRNGQQQQQQRWHSAAGHMHRLTMKLSNVCILRWNIKLRKHKKFPSDAPLSQCRSE